MVTRGPLYGEPGYVKSSTLSIAVVAFDNRTSPAQVVTATMCEFVALSLGCKALTHSYYS